MSHFDLGKGVLSEKEKRIEPRPFLRYSSAKVEVVLPTKLPSPKNTVYREGKNSGALARDKLNRSRNLTSNRIKFNLELIYFSTL